MKSFSTSELISSLKGITENNLKLLKQKFSHLSDNQKNWRPNKGSWSLNEIFAHLNEYSKFYHPAISEKIEKTKFDEPKDIFISSPLGRSAWKSMKLGRANNVKRKFNAQKGYNPTVDTYLVKDNTFEEINNYQTELLTILDNSLYVNLRKVKVPISISRIVRLRLGDALMFVIYHNERHMQQALKVIGHSNFPKKNA